MRFVGFVLLARELSVDSPETKGVVFGVDVGGRSSLVLVDLGMFTGVHTLPLDAGESGKLASVSE